MATNHIPAPRFSSPEEEAKWWEQHAPEVEGTELDENPFAGRVSKVAYSLHLDAADIDRLEVAAQRRGVYPTQLAREWIVERLAADEDDVDPASRLAALSERLRLDAAELVELAEFATWAAKIVDVPAGSGKAGQTEAMAKAISDHRLPRFVTSALVDQPARRSIKPGRPAHKTNGKRSRRSPPS